MEYEPGRRRYTGWGGGWAWLWILVAIIIFFWLIWWFAWPAWYGPRYRPAPGRGPDQSQPQQHLVVPHDPPVNVHLP